MSIPIHGRTLKSQSQQLILNLLNYFEREKAYGGSLIPLTSVQERVSNALGISVSSISRIRRRSLVNPILSSPGKSRKRQKVKTSDLSENSKMNIRNAVYTMYTQKKHLTVALLNKEIQQLQILLSNSSLNRILHEIGFKFVKEGNRRALVEKNNIAMDRIHFFKNYRNNLNSPFQRNVVFLDETWIFSKGNPGMSWQDSSTKSVRKPNGYDGKRFIVLHAGSKLGFIDGASLVFASKSQKEDYHGEMNGELFKKWIDEKLICNLEEPSLIIMDNPSYHSTLVEKMPSSSWTKPNIAAWLTTNNIEYEPSMFRPEFLALAKLNKKEKRYKVDELLRSHGHEVLRLPPYHCEFNAIELIWAHCKTYYNKHIGRDGSSDDKVIDMWNEALQNCSPEVWKNVWKYGKYGKVWKDWYEREKALDITVNELIININDSSDSEESDYD